MPQSASLLSTRLSNKSARRYRTLSHTSQVDETLFGPVKQSECEIKSDPKGDSRSKSCSALVTKGQNPNTIRIITKDHIRDLRIPKKDPSKQSIILGQAEYERIKDKCHVLTKEEKDAALASQRKAREEAMVAAEERKMLMEQADFIRQKNQGLTDLEAEATERAQNLLERANAQRMEQEDEIKKFNELILEAQCNAVRDAQMQEKKQILSELQEEEHRLDGMMEVDRRHALEIQEQIDELRKTQRIEGKMCILKQIDDRQEERLLQDELKEQEGQQMLEKLKKLQMKEFEALDKKKEEKKKLQLEIQKINEESLRVKERRIEEEKLADFHAMEYTRKKLEREAEYEAEQKRIKKEKEKEVARLRALQERDRDHKAEQDALRARRNQEDAEREWRKKEKEQAKKKLEEEAKLKAARLDQVKHKQRMLSIEVGRKRAEFDRVLRVQQELIEQEKRKEEQYQQHALHHAEAVRQQIREREAQAISQRRDFFREGEKLDEEARIRRVRLEEIKMKKLNELRTAGLPEKYCSTVERKLYNY